MNNIQELKQIIENAPEGATHCDGPNEYFRFNGKYWSDYDFDGNEIPGMPDFIYQNVRQLSDLRTIVDQHEEIERLKIATDNSKVNAALIEENEQLKARVAELEDTKADMFWNEGDDMSFDSLEKLADYYADTGFELKMNCKRAMSLSDKEYRFIWDADNRGWIITPPEGK